MPTCLLEAYEGQMQPLAAEAMLDAATAADYPGWKPETRTAWWRAQAKQTAPIVSDVPTRRRSAFSWNGTPIASTALKQNLASALGRGFARD